MPLFIYYTSYSLARACSVFRFPQYYTSNVQLMPKFIYYTSYIHCDIYSTHQGRNEYYQHFRSILDLQEAHVGIRYMFFITLTASFDATFFAYKLIEHDMINHMIRQTIWNTYFYNVYFRRINLKKRIWVAMRLLPLCSPMLLFKHTLLVWRCLPKPQHFAGWCYFPP